jgi:hypothetical protein
MRSSVAPSVAPSVPASTGPGANNPAMTIPAPATANYPSAAATGEAAGGTRPTPNGGGRPPAWMRTFASAIGWKPSNPQVNQGRPEALPGGQGANWVQPAIARGISQDDAPRGRAADTFKPQSGDWSHQDQFTPHDIQSQDVDPRGFVNLHPNDRQDFFIRRGSDAIGNVTYWPAETSQTPDSTPLAVIPGALKPYPNRDVGGYAFNNAGPASQWVPGGVNSAYTEPAPPQPTAQPAADFQADPAQEWL